MNSFIPITQCYVFFNQGKICDAGDIREIEMFDVGHKKRGEFLNLTDLFEVDIFSTCMVALPSKSFYGKEIDGKSGNSDKDYTFLKQYAQTVYDIIFHEPSAFGDVVVFTLWSCRDGSFVNDRKFFNYYTYNFVAKKAFHKPQNAADLVVLLEDPSGAMYFMGIVRKNDPGKGKCALPGGKLDIHVNKVTGTSYLETPLENLIHEAMEEIGFRIAIRDEKLLKIPYVQSVPVVVYFPTIPCTVGHKTIYDTNLELLGTFVTADSETIKGSPLKRIYWTTGYRLELKVDFPLNENALQQLFRAGDDAAKLQPIQIRNTYGDENMIPEFGMSHHMTIFDMAIKK